MDHTWLSRGFDGKVVGEVGEPLEGVLVLVSWRVRSPYEGAPSPPLIMMEAKTDSSGTFHFVGWGPAFSLTKFMRCDEPIIHLLRDGYLMKRVSGGKCMEFRNSIFVDSTPKAPLVEMTRVKGKDEALLAAESVMRELYGYDMEMSSRAECMWARVPHFYAAARRFEEANSTIPGGFADSKCGELVMKKFLSEGCRTNAPNLSPQMVECAL